MLNSFQKQKSLSSTIAIGIGKASQRSVSKLLSHFCDTTQDFNIKKSLLLERVCLLYSSSTPCLFFIINYALLFKFCIISRDFLTRILILFKLYSPLLFLAINFDPIPTQVTPALNHFSRLS